MCCVDLFEQRDAGRIIQIVKMLVGFAHHRVAIERVGMNIAGVGYAICGQKHTRRNNKRVNSQPQTAPWTPSAYTAG